MGKPSTPSASTSSAKQSRSVHARARRPPSAGLQPTTCAQQRGSSARAAVCCPRCCKGSISRTRQLMKPFRHRGQHTAALAEDPRCCAGRRLQPRRWWRRARACTDRLFRRLVEVCSLTHACVAESWTNSSAARAPFIRARLVPTRGARWTPPVRSASSQPRFSEGRHRRCGAGPRREFDGSGPQHRLRLRHVVPVEEDRVAVLDVRVSAPGCRLADFLNAAASSRCTGGYCRPCRVGLRRRAVSLEGHVPRCRSRGSRTLLVQELLRHVRRCGPSRSRRSPPVDRRVGPTDSRSEEEAHGVLPLRTLRPQTPRG